MEDTGTTNPLFIVLFFLIRCGVPLLVMLGISYLLQRLGVIARPSEPPAGWDNGKTDGSINGGDLAHAKH